MLNFNWVDYVIVAIFFFSIMAGLWRGFVREVLSLLTLVAAFIVATMYSSALAIHFIGSPSAQNAAGQATAAQPSTAALGISYTALFVGTMLIGALISYFINMAFQTGILGFGNRLMGAAFGLARGFLFSVVIVFLVQLTPSASEEWWQKSQLVGYYQPAVQWVGNIVSPSLANLKEKFGKGVEGVTAKIQDAVQGAAQNVNQDAVKGAAQNIQDNVRGAAQDAVTNPTPQQSQGQ